MNNFLKLTTILSISFFLQNSFSQEAVKKNIEITYNTFEMIDIVNKTKTNDEMKLLIVDNNTKYWSLTRIKSDSILNNTKLTPKEIAFNRLKGADYTLYFNKTTNQFENFRDNNRRQIGIEEIRFQYNELIPNLKWEISNETKTIIGYNCQKATTNYKGLVWTAWFSEDIPVNAGPWKLRGLPGLILEANDAKDDFHFTAIQLKNTLEVIDKTIDLNSRKIELKEYKQIYSEQKNKLQYLFKSLLEIPPGERRLSLALANLLIGNTLEELDFK